MLIQLSMKMKKVLKVISVSVFALVALAACSDEKIPQSRVDVANEITSVLASVHDAATADVAADKVAELIATLEKFPETTEENAAAAADAVSDLASQGMRLGKENYFGSEKLRQALEGTPSASGN